MKMRQASFELQLTGRCYHSGLASCSLAAGVLAEGVATYLNQWRDDRRINAPNIISRSGRGSNRADMNRVKPGEDR